MPRGGRKDWAGEHLNGFENLLVPSFDAEQRSLDEEAVRLDVRQSLAHGVCATRCALEAGLTLEEKKRMLEVAAAEAAGRIGVSFLLMGPVEECRALLAHAESVGATHACLGYPQGFQPGSDAELVDFARRIIDGSGLAITLAAGDRFAFPLLHPSGVPLAAFERLADLDNVVGLELASMDTGLILECCERFAGRLLLSTPQPGMLPILTQCCAVQWGGAWPIEGLQSPREPHAVRFLELLRAGSMQEAMQLYWRLAPALGALARLAAAYAHTGAQHWPLVKYQQWLSGGNGGLTRQPVMRLFQRDMQAMRAALRTVGVECADPDEAFFVGRAAQARAA